MAYVVLVHATFDNQADADHVYDQAQSVATAASVARIGEYGERSSHALVGTENADGTLSPLRRWHLDLFGIVREGEPDPNEPPAWIQPSGAQDAYPLTDVRGDPARVTHNGATWENTMDANTWEPGVSGWTEV
jgi:hypothetical protein